MPTNLEILHEYCCLDSAVTYEINAKIDRFLKPESRRHYNFNITLLNALLYIELRGIKYDHVKAQHRLKECQLELSKAQNELDSLAGFGLKTTDKLTLRLMCRDVMGYKNNPSKPKKDFIEDYDRIMRILLGEGELSPAELGYISSTIGKSLNVRSKDLKTYLYETLKMPVQKDPVKHTVTTSYEALLRLKQITGNPVVSQIIRVSELSTRHSRLQMSYDVDGRVRSSYNVVGSETGRVTCKKSPTGVGRNAQATDDEDTLKEEDDILREGLRDLLKADDGCYIGKCDLRGADGWTVGANLAALGDDTMLEDLKAGVKPAQVLALALRHLLAGNRQEAVKIVTERNREKLKELCKSVKKDDWLYFACKQCIWGYCYLMGAAKAASHVFKVSQGQVDMTEVQMADLKSLLFVRYHVSLWWNAFENKLKQPYPPQLTSPSGHTRKFFGRKQEILGQALAHEPQSVTTYATNMAMFRLWNDPQNRIGQKLRIEPIHQVHDEMVVQFKIEDTDWAVNQIKSYFDNEIVISGIKVKIPFEGAYGTNWSMNDEAKRGTI